MMRYLVLFLSFVFLFSCSPKNKTYEIGERYFEFYSKRASLDKMLSFYSDDFEYTNVNFEMGTDSPEFLFNQLYSWNDPNFKYSSENTIQLHEIVSSESSIVAKGVTLPYTYNGKEVDGTPFVIWLELDENLKIKKQTDWFDYPMAEIIEAWQLKNALEIK